MYDLLIRGGQVADGTGRSRPRTADVAITGDRIMAVGHLDSDRAHREVDADGLLVTPGWVDIHTHYDGQVTWDPDVSPSGWHGVTTIVMGNCGVGFAPARRDERAWLIQLMEGVEDIPGTALTEGMSWNWESFPDYLDEVGRMPRLLDVAALLPHGALRAYVLGEGRANDAATPDEIEQMTRLARQAIEAGAVGISTTRTMLHRAKDGELAAGTNAPAVELIGIGRALARAGRRVFSVASDMLDLDGEFAWMAAISSANRVPVTYQTLQVDFAPDLWRTWVNRGVEANRRGAWLVPQVAGKPTSVMIGFESTVGLFSHLADWQPLVELPHEDRVARLRDPEVRAALLGAPAPESGLPFILHAQLHKLFPLGDPPDYEPPPEASVTAIAARERRSPLEVAYDLMLRDGGKELLYLPVFSYAPGDFSSIQEMIEHPATVLGLGDGGAHCGVLCDASLPTFMLSHWARDRTRGPRLPVEQAVHLQTRRTAELYGFDDRGLLAPGHLADVNVIDFEGLSLSVPRMAHDLPAGGKRLVQSAAGYVATVKSGVVVREHDQPTGERPGRLLRGPQAGSAG
jgi:N-acyl-D-aspartate/D-glutamate deacylase